MKPEMSLSCLLLFGERCLFAKKKNKKMAKDILKNHQKL